MSDTDHDRSNQEFTYSSASHLADDDDGDESDAQDNRDIAHALSARLRGLSQPTLPDHRVLGSQHNHLEHQRKPLTYSSLPSTPVLPDPVIFPDTSSPLPQPLPPVVFDAPPFSLWDYLREELLATDFDSHQELKWERVSNFLSVPVAIEKVRSSSIPTYSRRTSPTLCKYIERIAYCASVDSAESNDKYEATSYN